LAALDEDSKRSIVERNIATQVSFIKRGSLAAPGLFD